MDIDLSIKPCYSTFSHLSNYHIIHLIIAFKWLYEHIFTINIQLIINNNITNYETITFNKYMDYNNSINNYRYWMVILFRYYKMY